MIVIVIVLVLMEHVKRAIAQSLHPPIVARAVAGVSSVRLHVVEVLLLGRVDLVALGRTLGESEQPVELILGDFLNVLHDGPSDALRAGWRGQRAIVHPKAFLLGEWLEQEAHVDLLLGVGVRVETIIIAGHEALHPVVLGGATCLHVEEDTHDGQISISVRVDDVRLGVVVLAVDLVLGWSVPVDLDGVVALGRACRVRPLDSGALGPALIEVEVIVDLHVGRCLVAGGHRVGAESSNFDLHLFALGDFVLRSQQVDRGLRFAISAERVGVLPVITTLGVVVPSDGLRLSREHGGGEKCCNKSAHFSESFSLNYKR